MISVLIYNTIGRSRLESVGIGRRSESVTGDWCASGVAKTETMIV